MQDRSFARYRKTLGAVLFCLVLSIPIILPYFHKGFFPTHDGEWAVVRLTDMFRSLRDHEFPVRYSGVLNFEYGYPLFNFAYPFPYYAGVLLHFLKINFVDSIKVIFALTVPFSLIAMFLVSRTFWKSTLAGIISVTLYALLPYRFVDLYVRGSIGESIAFVLFPAMLYCLILINEGKKRGVIGGALCLAILVMSHNIMSVLFLPILGVSMVFFYKENPRTQVPFITLLILGLSISAFFWLPALLEKHFILLSQIPIAERNLYFVKPLQLIIPTWGYGTPTGRNPFTYQIGFPQVILFILVAFLVFFPNKKRKQPDGRMLFLRLCILLTMVYVFMLFSKAAGIWRVTPLLKEINYPWTMLLPIGFLISFVSGALCLFKKYFVLIGIVVVCFSFYFLSYAHPAYYVNRGDGFYLTNEATTTSSKELTPLWVKKLPFARPDKKLEVLQGKGVLVQHFFSSKTVQFSADMQRAGVVRINTIYYPGWQITDNGSHILPRYTNDKGVMDVSLSQGHHNITAQFLETPLRLFSDMISVFGIMLLLTYSLVRKGWAFTV